MGDDESNENENKRGEKRVREQRGETGENIAVGSMRLMRMFGTAVRDERSTELMG